MGPTTPNPAPGDRLPPSGTSGRRTRGERAAFLEANVVTATFYCARPVGAVATVTTATATVDRMAEAVGRVVEIAQHVTSVTGTPVAVSTDAFGQMGGMTWIGVQRDLASRRRPTPS